MSNMKDNKTRVSFLAIDPYLESNIVSPREQRLSGKDFVEWGDRNGYPDYLLDLYNNVSTLRSVVNGTIDFIAGDSATIVPIREGMTAMNGKGETIFAQIKSLAKDFCIYGGFALQVIRGRDGEVSEIYHIDMRHLRSNKENDVFYYCEDWQKGGKKNVVVYPAFKSNLNWEFLTDEERDRHASSILFVKNVQTQVYPAPLYAASVKACEMERCIDDYHLNAINNGFTSSYIINFNNGQPTDEMRKEIEDMFTEKFTGHQNAARVMFSWNKNKENAITTEKVDVEDFGVKYESLAKHSRQQIFTAFRANPNLFGIPTESLGFSQEEYESAFRLYNRTQVRPVQKMIADAYERIYGQQNVLTIVPFSLEEGAEKSVN